MWAGSQTETPNVVGGSGAKAARETSDEGAALLERLDRAGMVDRGRVVLIGLDALRDRFGDRWEKKADLIWQVALHHIKKRIGPDDLAARVGDVEAVIAVAGDASRAASLGLAISQELFTYFLGQSQPSDLRLNRVVSVDGREIGVQPLPTDGVTPAPLGEGRSFAPLEPQAAHPDWSALSLQGRGMKLDERFVIEPLISLKLKATAAKRIGVTVIDQRAGGKLLNGEDLAALTPVELLALDAGVIDHALGLPEPGVALVLPLSFQTLSSSRGRALLLQRGGGEEQLAARRPIIEVVGLDNAPIGRLIEVASLIAPACRAVVAQIDARLETNRSRWSTRLGALRGCRLGGVSVDFAARKETGVDRLAALVGAARELAPLAFAFNVPDAEGMMEAAEAGFTHAALATAADAKPG